jgi:PKD repeat protein
MMSVEELERRELMATSLGTEAHFDFDTNASPAAPGYTHTPLVAYTATRGYGWASVSGMSARDRGSADPLTRDVHLGRDSTFRANLVNGTYDVTVTLGDPSARHDNVAVWAEGRQVASGLTTAAGQFLRPTYRVVLADGQLTLRLVDTGGSSVNFAVAGLDVVQVNGTAPVANAGPDFTVNEGAARTFAGSVTGGTAPFTYAWDFGDSGTTTGTLTPSHTYADNGSFTVTLTVTDAQGLFSQDTATATVRNVAPTANVGGPYGGAVGAPIAFAVTATDPSAADTSAGFTYAWDFGDAGTSSQRTPSHAYAAAGTYTVTVSVTDKDGGVGTATTTATVTGASSGNLANVGLTVGWATFGQALPQGAAFGGLKLGSLVTQTDVKTLWPDGSIRYAIVSAAVPAAGVYPLRTASASTGSFTPAALGAWVAFDTGYGTYTATLPAAASTDGWLRGPLVSESRWTVTPVSSSGSPHPFLRVLVDVRSYVDGQRRLDVTVENTLDTAAATAATYNVRIGVGSQVLFQRDAVTHPYLTRWRQAFGLNLTAAEVTPDFQSAYQAHALPRYLSVVSNEVSWAWGPDFDILGSGTLNPYMPEHGGRPELAPYPDWAARYLVHKDPTQGQFVLANGDLAGSWPVHVRSVDGRFVTIDERPDFWLDWRADPWNRPAGDLGATGTLVPDVAHQPSLAYIPYLVTGDRYYADEMAFWANYVLLNTWQDAYYNARGGAQGLLYSNEVRGVAWGLRNLVDAAAYLPDASPLKNYFAEKVQNNLTWLDDYAASETNPLGILWAFKRPENVDPSLDSYAWIALWEQNYVAWSIDHANKQGFAGGLLHRDRIARLQLSLFTNPATRDGAAPYLLPVGTQTPAGSGQINWFTSIEQTYVGPVQFAGYYGVDARLMLMIGLENGWAGAQQAYNYLTPQLAVDPYLDGVSDLANRAGWALALDWEA